MSRGSGTDDNQIVIVGVHLASSVIARSTRGRCSRWRDFVSDTAMPDFTIAKTICGAKGFLADSPGERHNLPDVYGMVADLQLPVATMRDPHDHGIRPMGGLRRLPSFWSAAPTRGRGER